MPKRLIVVAGTRPETIKIYSVLRYLDKFGISYEFVWTSQHYDYEMSRVFFEELKLPEPDRYLNIPRDVVLAERFASMVSGLASSIGASRDTVVYALGDTASTLAAAVAAAYSGAVFVHDESGVRSFDLGMVEEVNRRLADQLAWLHLAPSPFALLNLVAEGILCETVMPTGSTLVDTFREIYPLAARRSDDVLSELGVSGDFILVTVHRRENLRGHRLRKLVEIMLNTVKRYGVELVLPLHPHTRNRLRENGLMEMLSAEKHVKLVKPLGYIEFLGVLSRSKAVMTDSGGVQQEAFLAGKPVLTLRPSTEWVETVLLGYNNVVDLDWRLAVGALDAVFNDQWPGRTVPPAIYGDGYSGKRVAKLLGSILEGDLYQRLANIRNRLAEGPLVLVPLRKAGERHSMNTICCGGEGIVPECSIWGNIVSVSDSGMCCLALSQFKLSCRSDVERLKRLVTSFSIDWGRVDRILESIV